MVYFIEKLKKLEKNDEVWRFAQLEDLRWWVSATTELAKES